MRWRSFPLDTDATAEFNRVIVYVVPSTARVEKMAGVRNAARFHVPRVSGSIAFTPKLGDPGDRDLSPRIVLFHEYAHHFQLGAASFAYPAWFMRFLAARQLILDDDPERARTFLRPLAADPHVGPGNGAERLLALLDAGHTGQTALDALEKAAGAGEVKATRDPVASRGSPCYARRTP